MKINYRLLEEENDLVFIYLKKDLPLKTIERLAYFSLDSIIKWYALRCDEEQMYKIILCLVKNLYNLSYINFLGENRIFESVLRNSLERYKKEIVKKVRNYIDSFDKIYLLNIPLEDKPMFDNYTKIDYEIFKDIKDLIVSKNAEEVKTNLTIYQKGKYTSDYDHLKNILKDLENEKCLILFSGSPNIDIKLKDLNEVSEYGKITSLVARLTIDDEDIEEKRIYMSSFFVRANKYKLYKRVYNVFQKYIKEFENVGSNYVYLNKLNAKIISSGKLLDLLIKEIRKEALRDIKPQGINK